MPNLDGSPNGAVERTPPKEEDSAKPLGTAPPVLTKGEAPKGVEAASKLAASKLAAPSPSPKPPVVPSATKLTAVPDVVEKGALSKDMPPKPEPGAPSMAPTTALLLPKGALPPPKGSDEFDEFDVPNGGAELPKPPPPKPPAVLSPKLPSPKPTAALVALGAAPSGETLLALAPATARPRVRPPPALGGALRPPRAKGLSAGAAAAAAAAASTSSLDRILTLTAGLNSSPTSSRIISRAIRRTHSRLELLTYVIEDH